MNGSRPARGKVGTGTSRKNSGATCTCVAGGGMAEEPIDALATSSRGCVRAWGEDRPKAPMAIRLIVLHSMIVELYAIFYS